MQISGIGQSSIYEKSSGPKRFPSEVPVAVCLLQHVWISPHYAQEKKGIADSGTFFLRERHPAQVIM